MVRWQTQVDSEVDFIPSRPATASRRGSGEVVPGWGEYKKGGKEKIVPGFDTVQVVALIRGVECTLSQKGTGGRLGWLVCSSGVKFTLGRIGLEKDESLLPLAPYFNEMQPIEFTLCRVMGENPCSC